MSMNQQRTVHLHLPKNDKLDIEFDNLTYSVPHGRGVTKDILHSIAGCFKSGELTGIMGPSGAGKSSLLNILSGFQKKGIQGDIRCTGQQEKYGAKIKYKKDSCYILQDDRLCPLFTVNETMHMAAKLKLGNSVSDKTIDLLICEILNTLGLSSTVDTRCARISGGQRKRLSIALELIDNPPIMFLDEPTTGLDSSSSYQCISMLKKLAEDGRTIVCTIHQPSASIFEMFDHIYVLTDGHCIFQGAPTKVVPYLSNVGLECPKYHNPADYLIEVACGEYGNFVDLLSKGSQDSIWREAKEIPSITEKEAPNSNISRQMVLINKPSEFYRFGILFQRSILQLYRDWTVTHLKVALHIIVGIIVGILYLNYGNDGSKSIKNIGYFIVSIVYLSYTTMMPAIVKLPSEVPVLKKENFNNWYDLRTYYFAYLCTTIPIQIFFAILYSTLSYFITGQLFEVARFVMFLAILCLTTLVAEGIGVIIGTSANPINGTFFGAILTALFIVLAGFLILFAHMPKVLYAVSYISYIAYGLEGLTEALYGFGRHDLPCPEDITYCHYVSPSIILKELSMDKNNYYNDLMVLTGAFLLSKLVGFCTLKRTIRAA